MHTLSFFVLLLFIWGSQGTIQNPSCKSTTCTQDSSCPEFADPTYFPICISGTCTGSGMSTMDIGEMCNSTSPYEQCGAGLVCTSAGMANGTAVCQYLRSYGCPCAVNEQCEGALCFNGACDAIRSIGDPCVSDLQCGSVCVNGACALGSTGDKCNSDNSCESAYCNIPDNTCIVDTRGNCSESNPSGSCSDTNAVCFSGTCYAPNGDLGEYCNSSVPFPQCKLTLACINETCAQVPEGTPCTTRSQCHSLQDCVCGATGQYGCYTKIGAGCAVAYQELDDCLSGCTEKESWGIPGTCASGCESLRLSFVCCKGCATGSNFYDYLGTCPSLVPVKCCSSTETCSVVTSKEACSSNSNGGTPPPSGILASPAGRVGLCTGWLAVMVGLLMLSLTV